MTHDRYAKWRDSSFPFAEDKWMPEVIIDVIEGGNGIHGPVSVSAEDHGRIKRGEVTFSTCYEAKEAARAIATKIVWTKWGIPEERLIEWSKERSED